MQDLRDKYNIYQDIKGSLEDVLVDTVCYEYRLSGNSFFKIQCQMDHLDLLNNKYDSRMRRKSAIKALESKALESRFLIASVIKSALDSLEQMISYYRDPDRHSSLLSVELGCSWREKYQAFLKKYLKEESELVEKEDLHQYYSHSAVQSQQEGMAR
jgi:hypothetical protein